MLVCEDASEDVLHVQLTFNIRPKVRPKVRPEVRPKPLYTQAKACCWGYGPGHKGSWRTDLPWMSQCVPHTCVKESTQQTYSLWATHPHI